jgi:hypothetical protein
MAAVFRAMTISETRAYLKTLIETGSDRILGFTTFGAGAGDVTAASAWPKDGGHVTSATFPYWFSTKTTNMTAKQKLHGLGRGKCDIYEIQHACRDRNYRG